jgi:S-adenosylhomocysteine hydrolase
MASFVRLGCQAADIHVLGKFYSSSPSIEEELRTAGFDIIEWQDGVRPGRFDDAIEKNIVRLWEHVQSRASRNDRVLVVLDDGGRCRQYCPGSFRSWPLVGIEQTTSGLNKHANGHWMPTIEVAGSAAKRTLEPPAVTASILNFVIPQFSIARSSSAPIGVVGLGTVGEDLARQLARRGHKVYVYDKNAALCNALPETCWCESMRELFEQSRYILGCTGEDLAASADWIDEIPGDKVLASCSSEDVEFRTWLRRADANCSTSGAFAGIEIRLPRGKLRILRDGFPANFTGTRNSGPIPLIQVTRALLLAGVVQAAVLGRTSSRRLPQHIMLDPTLQALIARVFLSEQGQHFTGETQKYVRDIGWLTSRSTGDRVDESVLGAA